MESRQACPPPHAASRHALSSSVVVRFAFLAVAGSSSRSRRQTNRPIARLPRLSLHRGAPRHPAPPRHDRLHQPSRAPMHLTILMLVARAAAAAAQAVAMARAQCALTSQLASTLERCT